MVQLNKVLAVPIDPFKQSVDMIILTKVEALLRTMGKVFPISHVDYRETNNPGEGIVKKPGFRYFRINKVFGMGEK